MLIVFSIAVPAHAAEASDNSYTDSTGTIYFSNSTEQVLSSAEASEYDIYEVHFPVNSNARSLPEDANKESILNECEFVSETIIGNSRISTYSSDTLHQYLNSCSEITDISVSNNYLYIYYTTTSGEEIILCYDDSGLYNKVIYSPVTDSAVIEVDGVTTTTSNFRESSSYVVSDEMLDTIYQLLEDNNLDALEAMGNIHLDYDENGNAVVIPIVNMPANTRASLPGGFVNEAEMLDNLIATFPYQSNALIASTTLYSSLLSKNLSARVYATRNSYVRKSVNWKSFVAGTLVSVISTALGINSITGTIAVLTGLGIAISAYDTITTAIQLAKSAVYTYSYTIQGRIYDNVTWNDYVLVNSYFSSKCEFSGGYNNNDTFTWNVSYTPNAVNRTASEVANEAKTWYETHVYYDGECTLYYP